MRSPATPLPLAGLLGGLASALLVACAAGQVPKPGAGAETGTPSGGDGADGADGTDGTDGTDGGIDSGPTALGEAPKPPDDACSSLYDPDFVPAFEIDIEPADWAALEDDYAVGRKSYHPVVFRYDGEEVTDAMIRLKGNPSFSWFTEKMQFVIAFNEVDPDGRFHGLRKLSLDATWYEPTMLRDRIGWQIIRDQGQLPGACANSATLTVNGEYYGLFTNIEYYDHEWLERSFGDADATGTLWKYGSDPVANAEASTGEAIWALGSTTDPDELAALGDVDEWMLEWAAEVVLGDDDGYWCCDHNYYLYEHPSRGILFIPWDLDDAYDVQGYDVDPINGYATSWLFRQPQFHAIVNDPTYGPRFVDQVELMNNAMDPATTLARLDAWQAQIDPLLEADPHRSIGWEEHEQAMPRMADWVVARHAFLESWVACQRGATTDADGDGHAVCADRDDGDNTIHPGAAETCDGRDDDQDGVVDDDPACDDCARHDADDSHFLFCRSPRTQAEAAALCADRGGALGGPLTGGETTMFYFYTWPVTEHWWTGGAVGGGKCATWDEASFSSGAAPCGDEHPSVCRLP